MTMATKQEILRDKLAEYLQADKPAKSRILDHLQDVSKLHRKAIIRRLKRLQSGHMPDSERRGRKEVYHLRVTIALKDIWQTANGICAERLQPAVADYVKVLRRDRMWPHNEAATRLLLAMSLGTMKNRIAAFTKIRSGPGWSTTKPSSLKEIIPIRRGPWQNPDPGQGEVDTVAHCGPSLRGDYAYSVQYTDVAVIWTSLSAQWNKGEKSTRESIERIKRRLPFPLKGIDPDSGGEFINYLIKGWCDSQTPAVAMTRIRPYHKNDHARIEQKNYVNIRQFLGYARLDDKGQIKLMNELYDLLEDYINFFLPSVKCLKKERTGSKYRRVYDQAQTAYQRALAHKRVAPAVKTQLQAKYATLNPKTLKREIDVLIRKILTKSKTDYSNT